MKRRASDVAVRERDIMERQLQHMVRLVDDLLDISRITRGSLELRHESLDLTDLVGKAVEAVSPMYKAKQQAVTTSLPECSLPVVGDETRLTQVLVNVLVNASKFTPNEGSISVRLACEGSLAVVRIKDSGMGMLAEELDTVFGSFVQGRQEMHRPKGGLGLGLAIADSLVRLHGGSIRAASDGRSMGSEFTISLPLRVHAELDSSGPDEASEPAFEARRILIVDDNLDARDSLAALLEDLGHAVVVAGDGSEALEVIADGSPLDVALLDIGLPGMNGYELGRQLRATAAGRAARIVAVTGFGQEGDIRRSSAEGFHAHLVKPVDVRELLALLRAAGAGAVSIAGG